MILRLLLPLLAAAVAMAGPARATEPVPDVPAAEELWAVIVEEDADTVEVWIALPPSVDPGTVEVQLAGHVVAVRARDDAGRTLRSAPLRLRGTVVEDGATARYEGSWLAVTLRKDVPPAPEL